MGALKAFALSACSILPRPIRPRAAIRPMQEGHPGAGALLAAAALSLAAVGGAGVLAARTYGGHPLLRAATPLELAPFAPPELPSTVESPWEILPFYYALGAWPKRFRGTPVFFTLPYEKGPPERFPGRAIARLRMPDTRLTFEGPKTPSPALPPAELQTCLGGLLGPGAIECLRARDASLARHVREMRESLEGGVADWDLRWFDVENEALPVEERARGFYLQAKNASAIQDRFILVGPGGTQQAIILDRPQGAVGLLAWSLVKDSIGSVRLSGSLDAGRAWVNRKLVDIQLESLRELGESLEYVSRLMDVQAMLVAKVTVEPSDPQAFYHLGGTAYMLARHADELRTSRTQLVQGNVLLLIDEWTAAAKPLVHASLRYLKDVAPSTDEVARLEELWLEAQKY